ncbi:MAG TPA: type II toxin-antitoxin system Phd/YefM family antitoxin [Streptosporangiaceae bacterium]|nr:type II toxin-antitoxin system Phd/YefM family antitoxin [Streptosporangiaceae bacterium]
MLNAVDVTVTQARAEFADLVNRVAYTGEPVALTRRGKVMAALISAEDLELLESLRARRFDLTGAGPAPVAEGGRPTRPEPLRIAAEYRPPGPGGPSGPPRRPGFRD